MEARREFRNYIELCDVAVCSNVTSDKYIGELKSYYRRRIDSLDAESVHEETNSRVLRADSPEAGRQLMALARAKMKVVGLA